MKRLLSIAVIALTACNGTPKNSKIQFEENNKETKATENDEALKKAKDEIRILFTELLTFKDNNDFHTKGFGQGSKYNSWIKKVQNMKNEKTQKLLIGLGFVPGDLEMLGFEYIKSKGQETDYSLWIKKTIEEGLKK